MIYHIEIAGKGGITQYTYNLVTHFNRLCLGPKAAIVSSRKYELENLPANFELIRLFDRFKSNPFKIFCFFVCHLKNKDLVHFQLSSFPLFVLILVYLLKIFKKNKLIITAHNVTAHETFLLTRRAIGQIYKLADRIIVHAESNKAELLNLFHFSEAKVAVIAHGNYLFANPSNQDHISLPPKDHFEILFFGFIREYKGLEYLIRAVKIIKEKQADVILQIAGKPKESFEKYARLIRELKIEDNIRTRLDYITVDEMKDIFKRADVVALPYKRISQSGIVFLAYAFGKAVVASNVGGLPEVVENGKSGFVVQAENPAALAEAILRFINQPGLAQKFGAYAKKLSETKYSWDVIAKQTLTLYESLNTA